MTQEAFRILFDKYYHQLYYFAFTFLKRFEEKSIEPEDVVQDVFLKVWKNDIYIQKEKMTSSLLYTMTKNRCLDVIMKEKVEQRTKNEVAYSLSLPEEELMIIEAGVMAILYEKINELPTGCRRVFSFYYMGMKTDQIAEKLKISNGNVRNQKTRAINLLKERMAVSRMGLDL